MTNSTKKDHATPITMVMVVIVVNTAEARATTSNSHKESISICATAMERRPRQQEAPAFVRTTSGKLLQRGKTSNSLRKVPTLSWPLCSASSTNLTTEADKTAIMYWYKPIYNHRISSRLCNHKPTSSTSAAKNRELTIQPTEAVVITPDNNTTTHIEEIEEAATVTTTMAASMATEVAEDNTTTTEVTPEALTAVEEAADID